MSLPLPPWQQPVCCWLCLPAVSHICPLLYSHSHCPNSGADYHLLGCSSNLCLTWISLGSQVNLPEVQLSPPAQLTAFQQLSYYLQNRAHTHSQHGLCSALSHYSFRVFEAPTCAFIGSLDIYWTTTWGFEDIKVKGNISDLKGLSNPPLPHSGLLTFLSPPPRMISTLSTLSLTSAWIPFENLHIPVPC